MCGWNNMGDVVWNLKLLLIKDDPFFFFFFFYILEVLTVKKIYYNIV